MQGAGLYTQMLYVFGFSFPFRTPHLGETLYGIEWIQSLGCVWFYFQRCIPFWSKENDLESSFPWSPTKIFWQEGSILPHQCVKIHTHETSPGLPHYYFFFHPIWWKWKLGIGFGDWRSLLRTFIYFSGYICELVPIRTTIPLDKVSHWYYKVLDQRTPPLHFCCLRLSFIVIIPTKL